MSIHEDGEMEVVKRSTLKREELRAGKFNRSYTNTPHFFNSLEDDGRSYSESGK